MELKVKSEQDYLSSSFPIENGLKQGNALSPLLFNLSLEYTISIVQETNLRLDMNGTHQALAYADDVNLISIDVTDNCSRSHDVSFFYYFEDTRKACCRKCLYGIYVDINRETLQMQKRQKTSGDKSNIVRTVTPRFYIASTHLRIILIP